MFQSDWMAFETEYPEWFAFVRSHRRRFDTCPDGKGLEESLQMHYLKRVISDAARYDLSIDLLYYPLFDDVYFETLVRLVPPLVERNYWHAWCFGHLVNNYKLLNWVLSWLSVARPPTFNINDDGQAWENNQLIQKFYAEYYPKPSPMERDGR